MPSNIITKEVDFMGDTLIVAQDENQQIWVGFRWVCDGIGLSRGQMNNETIKVKSDIVLSQGARNLVLPTKGGNQTVLCIMIDFLPLWLAKISITPKMKELTPHVVEKLVAYQLKAKDVLGAAFLPQYIQPKVEAQSGMTSMLNQFYCCLESSLRSDLKVRFNEAIPSIIQMLTSGNIPKGLPAPKTEVIEGVASITPLPILLKCPEGQDWKQWVYYMIDTYLMISQSRATRKDVLVEMYRYLCKHYGMVADQLAKEYRRNHTHKGRMPTIALIESDAKWRNIFDSVLCDKVNNAVPMAPAQIDTSISGAAAPVYSSEDVVSVAKDAEECEDLLSMIAKLILLRNDTTIHGSATYRAIYKKMYTSKQWNYKIAGYKRKMGVSTAPTRIALILSNVKLKKECTDIVAQMIEETAKQTDI